MTFMVDIPERARKLLPREILTRVEKQLRALADVALYPPKPMAVWLYPQERGQFEIDGYFISFEFDASARTVSLRDVERVD